MLLIILTQLKVYYSLPMPPVISGEVKDYLRGKGKLMRLPRSAHDLNIRVKTYTENIYYDKYIPVEQVAEGLGKTQMR